MKKISLINNFYLSIIIIVTLGFIFHYLYQLTNQNFFIGMISPVNESVFEHLKLVLYPSLIWWTIFYIINKDKINAPIWFLGFFISSIISMIIIMNTYYLLKYGFNISSLIMNIITLILAVITGQLLGYFIYIKINNVIIMLPIILIITLIISFSCLTINPPKLPIFKDDLNNTYGMVD